MGPALLSSQVGSDGKICNYLIPHWKPDFREFDALGFGLKYISIILAKVWLYLSSPQFFPFNCLSRNHYHE